MLRISASSGTKTRIVMEAGHRKNFGSGTQDATFAKDFRRILSGIRLKSAPALRSRKMSQSPLPLRASSPRTKAPVSSETIAAFGDAGRAAGRGFCEMPCEVFARLPQGYGTRPKCAAVRLDA